MLFKDIVSNFRGKPKNMREKGEKTVYNPDPFQDDKRFQRIEEESLKMMPPIIN